MPHGPQCQLALEPGVFSATDRVSGDLFALWAPCVRVQLPTLNCPISVKKSSVEASPCGHSRRAVHSLRSCSVCLKLNMCGCTAAFRHITIDLDPTDDPTRGSQQMTFFNAHYDTWCYLPVAGFVTFNHEPEQYLFAYVLRPGNARANRGEIGVLSRVVVRKYAVPRPSHPLWSSFVSTVA